MDETGNFVIVWTHEKLGSDDHVDMLGTRDRARARADDRRRLVGLAQRLIGKCRPKVSEELCLDTIDRFTAPVIVCGAAA